MDCLFCKIVAGDIPSKKAYEDADMLAFYDIAPQAPVHVLVVPKRHICGVDGIDEKNAEDVKKIFVKIPQIAADLGLKNGYRVISNVGPDACQSVRHLHFHVLGGAQMADRMA